MSGEIETPAAAQGAAIGLSANLGFLWSDRPLSQAIRAAKSAGFDAVECHFPYTTPAAEIRAALEETGLPMLSLNTERGDVEKGEFGLAAVPGREAEARALIDQAVEYGAAIGARNIHVMAGKTDGGAKSDAALRDNLDYAAARAGAVGMGVFIEPKNHIDTPGYHIASAEQAAVIIADLGAPNVAMMFDTYHIQILQGDVARRFERLIEHVGHVQIAGAPDRGAPDTGELDHGFILGRIAASGYRGYVAAEYRPSGATEASLGWIPKLRALMDERS